MMSSFSGAMLNSSPKSLSVTDNSAVRANISDHSPAVVLNTSHREDCIKVVFSEKEYLSWDNPNNIISAEVEIALSGIKNIMLGLLFLIGGPANIINMAVFCKQGLKDRVNLSLFALSFTDELYLTMAMVLHGEQLHVQFTTKERFGPLATAFTNLSLTILVAPFCYISPILSAIIATERCLCVFHPLKFQSLLRTRTMVMIIALVYTLVLGLFFIVTFRYRIGCVYDPESGIVIVTGVEGEFYKAHREFIDGLESLLFGIVLAGVVTIVVTVTTILTVVKLRQTMTWRSGTSSSISAPEVALTKMLVGNSVFFIICSLPIAMTRFVWIFFPEASLGRLNQNFFLAGIWISEIFTYFNATFNIVIYCIMGSHYRETFWVLFGRK